jgi:hypothetical protein
MKLTLRCTRLGEHICICNEGYIGDGLSCAVEESCAMAPGTDEEEGVEPTTCALTSGVGCAVATGQGTCAYSAVTSTDGAAQAATCTGADDGTGAPCALNSGGVGCAVSSAGCTFTGAVPGYEGATLSSCAVMFYPCRDSPYTRERGEEK